MSAGWLDAIRSLLGREQWAAVLVLAGAGLLVAPPPATGWGLLGWVGLAVVAAFLLVLAGSWVWSSRRA
ncbi:MAG: hypothetical protein ABEJ92_04220 [Halobacteriales archaeon]